jgi:hypothetical protein
MSADAEEAVHSFLDLAEVFLEAKRCLLKPWDFPPQRPYRRNISGCKTARGEVAAAVAENWGAHQLSDLRRTLPRRCIDGELAHFPGKRRTRCLGSVIDHFPDH